MPHYIIQQPAQENLVFKQLDKKLADIQEDLRDGNAGKNQVKQDILVLPKRKPNKLTMVNNTKLGRVSGKSNNMTLTATHGDEISSNSPTDKKHSNEKTSVTPSNKKPDKEPIIKPSTNLLIKSTSVDTAKIKKAIKIGSSPGMDDLVLGIEKLALSCKRHHHLQKEPNQSEHSQSQKSEPLNKQHPARPK